MQVEVDAEQDQGRDPVEAGQSNVGVDDRERRAGRAGDERDIGGRADGEPGVEAGGEQGEERRAGVLGGFGSVRQLVEFLTSSGSLAFVSTAPASISARSPVTVES